MDTRTDWHEVDGFVYSPERKTYVGSSWAEACPDHLDQVIDAITADVNTHPDAWRVDLATKHYGTNEPDNPHTVTHGAGENAPLTLF